MAAVVSYPNSCLYTECSVSKRIYVYSINSSLQPSGWRSKALAKHGRALGSASLSSLFSHHSQICTSHSGKLTSLGLPPDPCCRAPPCLSPWLVHYFLHLSPSRCLLSLHSLRWPINYQFVSLSSHHSVTVSPLHPQHLAWHIAAAQQILIKYNGWINAQVICIFK